MVDMTKAPETLHMVETARIRRERKELELFAPRVVLNPRSDVAFPLYRVWLPATARQPR